MSAHIEKWWDRKARDGKYCQDDAYYMACEIADLCTDNDDLRARIAELTQKQPSAWYTGQAATTASASFDELKQKLAEAIGKGNSVTIHGIPAPSREAALDDPKMAAYLRNEPWIAAYIETLECELRKAQAAHAGAEEAQRNADIAAKARDLTHKYFNGGISTSADIWEFWDFVRTTDAAPATEKGKP